MADFSIHPLGAADGHLALAPMPGRGGDLAGDVARIEEWGADLVISMTTDAEFSKCKSENIGRHLARNGIDWHRIPTVDFDVPDVVESARWEDVSRAARGCLADGGKVLIHCMGGCGRSGMAALRLMVEAGEDPHRALIRLRAVRPCAVETKAQFAWAAVDADIL